MSRFEERLEICEAAPYVRHARRNPNLGARRSEITCEDSLAP
jgi:hypothetical protein